ncbi:MAG: histidine phosphatase family protein [Anaerolineae bacterium]|nr:histidine phosphatase family protein [Anaerolineae bacterium]
MKLLLIRHGESVGNAEGRMQGQFDSPLSDRGRDQARALLARLQGEGWKPAAIYSSDLCRAAETASILAAGLDAPVTLDTRLREYDIGALSGVVWREVEVLYPEVWRRLHEDEESVIFPGEEGLDAFHERVSSVAANIVSSHQQDGTVAVVAHGGSLGMILAHLLRLALRRPMPFRFDNTSLSIVDFGPRGIRLALLNCTCHLNGGAFQAAT